MSIKFKTTNLAVLIATYAKDDPELLERALRSIFNQNLPEGYRINVYLGVDGPVNHKLQTVIESFHDLLHYVIYSPLNNGLAATLNNLIARLEDEDFVFRMDADDFSLPLRFRRQIEYLLENPDIDIIGTDIVEFDVESKSQNIVAYAFDNDDAKKKIALRVPVAHPTVCFRRRVFRIVPGYPAVRGNEDIAMWFECLRCGLKFGNVHEPLLQFTLDLNFWSRRSFSKSFSELGCYIRGIWSLNRFSIDYVYPVARFFLRVGPLWLSKYAYRSKYRSFGFKK